MSLSVATLPFIEAARTSVKRGTRICTATRSASRQSGWRNSVEGNYLAALRAAVEQWPETREATPPDVLADFEQEETDTEAHDLSMVFASLCAAWNIPSDVTLDMSLQALQQAVAEGLPENWASRQSMRRREK